MNRSAIKIAVGMLVAVAVFVLLLISPTQENFGGATITESITGTSTINSSQNNNQTDGLVGMWSFNGADLTTTTTTDRSGTGNDGTLTNGPPVPTIGQVGQGIQFFGTTDETITSFSTAAPSFGTISFWYKGDRSTGNDQYIFSSFTDGGAGDRIYLWVDSSDNSGDLRARLDANSGVGEVVGTATIDGEWHHVAMIYGTSAQVTQSKVYFDGVPTNILNATADLAPTAIGLAFGANVSGAGGTIQLEYEGRLDEMRLYNRVLSEAEIINLAGYSHTIGPFEYPAGRIANYLLDGDTVNTLGSDATNIGGTFVSDPAGERGTVWQGGGTSERIQDVLSNASGAFYSATIWVNSNDVLQTKSIIGNLSSNNNLGQLNTGDEIFSNFDGGSNPTWDIPALTNGVWFQLGISIEDKGSTLGIRIYIDGIESAEGELTTTQTSIPAFDSLGHISAGFYWNGEFSITNVWNTLLTPDDFLAVYNHELLP